MDDSDLNRLKELQERLDPIHFHFCLRVSDAWGYWPVDAKGVPLVEVRRGCYVSFYEQFGIHSTNGVVWHVIRREIPVVVDGEPLALSAAAVRAWMYDTCRRAFPCYKRVEREMIEKAWIALDAR